MVSNDPEFGTVEIFVQSKYCPMYGERLFLYLRIVVLRPRQLPRDADDWMLVLLQNGPDRMFRRVHDEF